MMDLIEKIIFPLCLALIGALILKLIEKKTSQRKKENRLILTGLIVLAVILSFLIFPPYRVSQISWNLQKGGTVTVKGKLTRRILFFSPVSDSSVQVKIFKIGASKDDPPVKDAVFGRTDVNGIFSVEFPTPAPPANEQYLINVAYQWGNDKWKISDFQMGDLKR
jgi:hypothetical protein